MRLLPLQGMDTTLDTAGAPWSVRMVSMYMPGGSTARFSGSFTVSSQPLLDTTSSHRARWSARWQGGQGGGGVGGCSG